MMARRSDSALASLLLVNRLTETAAQPFTAGEFWSIVDAVEDPARLLGMAAAEIASLTHSSTAEGERVVVLLDAGTAVAFELERLAQEGFVALTPFDEGYPTRLRSRLGDAAPPVLVAVGETGIMDREGVGIVGSRDVSPDGVAAARRIAEIAIDRDLPVVSGGARGVDQQSMAAAYQAGGKVVGVLAESLVRRVRDPETRRVIAEGAACLVTPYKPDAGFSVANAMGRNKVVYALSAVTVVIASDTEKGGTWEGAVEALRRDYGHVAVWLGEGAGPGNERLVARGAISISDLDDRAWLDPPERADAPPAPEQLRLG
jgi:predicted Rossmann fold nucleotide-binding protein DprA/Smf involved in DNA uptake